MKRFLPLISGLLFLTALSSTGFCQMSPERQWPSYRGWQSSGVLDNTSLPDKFNPKTGNNILWRTKIPGLGLSCPVIWDNKIFITSAVSKSDDKGIHTGIYGDITPVNDASVHEWKVFCIDKGNGKIIWEKTAATGVPKIKRHPKSTHANATAATDGRHVVAFFGSEGLYCYDYSGNLMWKKDLGILKSAFFMARDAEWEFASSPVIYNGKLIIQCDVLDNSFVAVYDVKSGKELWKKSREEYPGWCTPNIYTWQGKPYVVVNGYKHRGAYDLETGNEVWRMKGGGDIQIPTPVTGNNLIYFNSAHGREAPVIAVKYGASGDITPAAGQTTNQHIAWMLPRGGSYMQTLLLYRNRLYNLDWNGGILCLDPLTGKEVYKAKLGKTKSFVASPVASDGKIYLVDEAGAVFVIAAGDSFRILYETDLGDASLVAPAISERIIVFRTTGELIAAGTPK